jgi:hypothetical protein
MGKPQIWIEVPFPSCIPMRDMSAFLVKTKLALISSDELGSVTMAQLSKLILGTQGRRVQSHKEVHSLENTSPLASAREGRERLRWRAISL